MIAAPIGFNQLRPAMAVDPQLTSIQAFNNPFNTNKSLYIAADTSTANKGGVKVSGTNAAVGSGGFNLGTGDFTVELYAYMTAASTFNFMFEQSHGGPSLAVNTAGKIQIAQSWVSDIILPSMPTFPLNTWTYVTWVRASGSMAIFLNGIVRTAGTATNNFQQDPAWNVTYVGGGANGGNITSWPGYICGLRFSNIARYTATFTPPTTPFKDDANTLLLVQGGATGLNSISDDNT